MEGPAWSIRGLVQHGSRYPLKVEGAVQRPVGLLLPGVSTASELVRYFALYAALAAFGRPRFDAGQRPAGHGRPNASSPVLPGRVTAGIKTACY